ncbi:unnamed protein product [Amoebophrya sp. A120]|nr:unnamed protein product [Amoebophrya sp. A120]|eukprot:GSA120T00014777001.1
MPSSSSSSSSRSTSSFAESLPARMCYSAVSGMGAACFCHPFDVLRVQMQVGTVSRSFVGTAKHIVAEAGVPGLYNGLSAAFLRQWMYGSGRMGIYSYLLSDYKAKNGPKSSPTFLEKIAFGATSGGIGAFFGTPSEVAIVRMAADSQLPAAERRNYRNIVDCLSQIAKKEGLGSSGLYKGATITVIRAMALASTQLATYSETKVYLTQNYPDTFTDGGIATLLTCSLAGSLISNTASMPFDVVKSRIQNMPTPKPGEAPLYAGVVDCATKSVAKDGPLVLWRGFFPAFVKLAPYTVISLSLLEKITFLATGKAAL